jgi:hypothetical protein
MAAAAVPQTMNRPSQPTPFVRTMVISSSLVTSTVRELDHSRRVPGSRRPAGILYS